MLSLSEIRRCPSVAGAVEPGLLARFDRVSLLDAVKRVDPGRDEGYSGWAGRTEFAACLDCRGRPVLRAREATTEAGIPVWGQVTRPGVAYLPVGRVRRLLGLMTEAEVVLYVRPPGHLVTIHGYRKRFAFVMEGYRVHPRLDDGAFTPFLF